MPPVVTSIKIDESPAQTSIAPVMGAMANEDTEQNTKNRVRRMFFIGSFQNFNIHNTMVIYNYRSISNLMIILMLPEWRVRMYIPLAGILLNDIVALRLPLVVVVLFLYTVLPSTSVISIDTSSSAPKLSAPCTRNVPLFGLGAMDIPSLVLSAGTLTLKRVMVTELDNEEVPQRPSAVTSQVITSPL